MNEVPLHLFIFLILLTFVLIYKAVSEDNLLSLFSAFVSVILSFTLAKISINGQLVSNYGHISTDNIMVFETFTIQNGAQSLLFTMIAIFMTIRVIMILVEQYKDAYSEVTE